MWFFPAWKQPRLSEMSWLVLELWADNTLLRGQKIKRLGIDDRFVEHGPQHTLRDMVGIHTDGIARAMLNLLEDKN